jgi:hypothetical protein
MYVVIGGAADRITGPFKTPQAAAAFAKKEYPLAKWRISPIDEPQK